MIFISYGGLVVILHKTARHFTSGELFCVVGILLRGQNDNLPRIDGIRIF